MAEINIFVSLSVAIASIIRENQIPPVSEHEFLVILGFFEMLVISGTLGSMITYRGWEEASFAAFGAYYVAVLVLSLVNAFKGGMPSSQTKILERSRRTVLPSEITRFRQWQLKKKPTRPRNYLNSTQLTLEIELLS